MKNKKYVYKLSDDYCVLDLETTGLSFNKDRIIEIGIVKVRSGIVIDQYSQLVNPGTHLPEVITELTGISQDMLTDKPLFSEIKQDILEFIEDDLIVGHNLVSFDIHFLNREMKEVLNNEYTDTLPLARKVYPEFKDYKLTALVKNLKLPQNNHRALKDCFSTMELYETIKVKVNQDGLNISSLFKKSNTTKVTKKSKGTSSEITGKYVNEDNIFYNKKCVFTGMLETMNRKKAEQLVMDIGGICENQITQKTDFLIVGSSDYNQNLRSGKSAKLRHAEDALRTGQSIQIIDEPTFLTLVQLDIDNSSMEDKVELTEEEKELRRKLKLPVTKELFYYEHLNGELYTKHKVLSFQIVKEYDTWKSLEITVENIKNPIRIHGDYFSEMQGAAFTKEIKIIEPQQDENAVFSEAEKLLRKYALESNDEEHEMMINKVQNGYSYKCFRRTWIWIFKKSKNNYVIEMNNNPSNLYSRISTKVECKLTNEGKIQIRTINPLDILPVIKEEIIVRYNYARIHEPVEYFLCCSHTKECSAAGKCVQSDIKLAKGCGYKENLEKGKIFF